ncbi:helix-turn-helix domain-containing protein [Nocardioides limicola]|uniref:helix-turn-helix domain-containing protein n=1 Tax=Nocardioides limicola TaxID=2803368 RepID=UPI003555C377
MLKALRTEAGWSKADLAEKIGSDARQVSRYENNKVAPGLEAVIRMAETFNVSVDALRQRRTTATQCPQQPRRRTAG